MELWDFDLPHYGPMCEKIREGRGVSASAIAQRCMVHLSTITRNLERDGNAGVDTFECYVRALASEQARPRLTPSQAEIILQLFRHSNERKEREDEAAAISLEDIRSSLLSHQFAELKEELEQEDRPAFIMDAFWFIHAFNGACLLQFGIDPQSKYLYRWEAWNTVATKFLLDSPVRLAHVNSDEYFPPTIEAFFEDPRTYRFLFTIQMRLFLHRLHELSETNDFDFSHWWVQATRFKFKYKLKSLRRTLKYQGKGPEIHAEALQRLNWRIEITPGYPVQYTLAVWNPLGSAARKAFAQMRRSPIFHQIFYAADYDKNKDFHVNTWREVKDALARRLEPRL